MKFIVRFLVVFSTCCACLEALAQELLPSDYMIGSPIFDEYYVSTNGNDDHSGRSESQAFRTLSRAYEIIPKGTNLNRAIRINIQPGSYPESSMPNFWEDIRGTAASPVVIRGTGPANSTILQGDINSLGMRHIHFLNLAIIPSPAGDAFHCEQCDHVLLKGVTLNGGTAAHETLKVNQSKYFYVEDCDISGSYENNLDFVAVQYGHVIRSTFSNAEDWCAYVKGGSAQITLAGNTFHNCGTGGFVAGQGTGFEYMVSPWVHYEAYDIKFINNIVYDTAGAGMGVNGGYNVLMAFNTLYRVGSRSHAIELYRGNRGCDGDFASCSANAALGGWGGTGAEESVIPNRNIYIYNNIVYNPPGFETGSAHFAVSDPQGTLPGFGTLPFPSVVDTNLQIRGNIIWNGSSTKLLGFEDSQVCLPSNASCTVNQIRLENSINNIEPQFLDAAHSDFRPMAGSNIFSAQTFAVPAFAGGDAPIVPAVPSGVLGNTVTMDRGGNARTDSVAGAYISASSDLGGTGPGGVVTPPDDGGAGGMNAPQITAVSGRLRIVRRKNTEVTVNVTASDVDGDLQSVKARVSPSKGGKAKTITLNGSSGSYTGKVVLAKAKKFKAAITAVDSMGHSARFNGKIS